MNLVELSQRLKRIRLERGMTLEQVAAQAGLTRGWLSKVENFRVTPSLPALSAIADALGVTMSDLFHGLEARPKIVVVPREAREVVRRDEEVSSYTYEALAAARPARTMHPFLLTVPVHDDRPALTHAGEEFMLVLSGRADLEYDGVRHTLGEGDAAYIDGDRPHRLICLSPEPARVLLVYHGIEAQHLPDADGAVDDEPRLRG